MAVPKAVRTILDELVGDPKYTGECPSCTESFKLRDAGLFYLDNLSPEAESARQSRENGIQELAAQYKKKIDRIEKGAPKTSLAVNVGKVVEKVAPTLEGFPYPPNDCRFLAEPIDYLIFNGITARGKVDELIFMDIKTGRSSLNKHQRLVKDAIDHNRVKQRLY